MAHARTSIHRKPPVSDEVVDAVIVLKAALIARELAKESFRAALGTMSGGAQGLRSVDAIPLEVRTAGERLGAARSALDLLLLEDA